MPGPAWNRIRYSLYAPVYDRLLALLPLFRRGRRRAIELARPRAGERVLIVACGTGLDLEYLPRGARVTAIDITPAMVARTRERAVRLGHEVDARVMDAARMELPDDAFDLVLLHLAIAVVPDPVATIREVARVLAPGGRVSIFDKFLPEGREASLVRRGFNAVANLVASDVNRRLEPILAAGGLVLEVREVAGFGGAFVVGRAVALT